MTTIVKNRILLWILAILPFFFVIYAGKTFGSMWFFVFFLVYAFLYRPFLLVHRLLSMKTIEEKDVWKFFIPFYGSRYVRRMWLD
jgi:hypothetical protein